MKLPPKPSLSLGSNAGNGSNFDETVDAGSEI